MANLIPAWVVFVDAEARRSWDEDYIATSLTEARKHVKELKRMGFDSPVVKAYECEADYYEAKEAKGY